jgi:hypothetical protein
MWNEYFTAAGRRGRRPSDTTTEDEVDGVGYHVGYVFKYSQCKNTIADRLNRLVKRFKTVSLQHNVAVFTSAVKTRQSHGKTDSGVAVVRRKIQVLSNGRSGPDYRHTDGQPPRCFGRPLAP